MPETLLNYRVFVSSPRDLAQQRLVAKKAIESLSQTYERRGIKISAWLWEDQSTSEMGDNPQAIITRQLGPFDIYLGLMGARFGTPTGQYGSGTEQEFRDALSSYLTEGKPRLSFFFKEVILKSSEINSEVLAQLTLVNSFRGEIGKVGLYREFVEDHVLSSLVSSTVAKLIDDNTHLGVTELQQDPRLQLSLPGRAISRNFLSETLNYVDDNLTAGGERLNLDTIWIDPDLRDVSASDVGKPSRSSVELKNLPADFQTSGTAVLISGGETSGKSAICHRLYQMLFAAGHLPVLIAANRINNPDIDRFRRRVRAAFNEQYEGADEITDTLLREKCIIIVDDYDAVRLSQTHAAEFLAAMKNAFHGLVLTVPLGYEFQFLERASDVAPFGFLRRLEIGDLGHKKRYALIERWCEALNRSQDMNAHRHLVESRRKIVNRVLGSNLVPRTPFMVLILLQAIDAGKDGELIKTGYVRYYKFLIDSAILRNSTPKDAEGAYALLPELAWAMHSSEEKVLSASQAEQVIERFAEQKALSKTSLYSVLGGLHTIGMFDSIGDDHRFRHPYTYYFFLAEYINARMRSGEMNEVVIKLCREVSIKESATLLVFLAYYSDNEVITSTLLEGLSSIYSKSPEFEFTNDRASSINRLVFDLPKIIFDPAKLEEQRLVRLESEEQEEREESRGDGQADGPVSMIRSTFTAVEILGHILRNHYAKLDAQPKRVIIDAASKAVLRCISDMFHVLSESSEVLVTAVSSLSNKVDNAKSLESKARAASDALFFLAYAFTYYCCRQLARAIGDENLEVTYRQILKENPTSSMRRFLDALVKLEAFKDFPLEEVGELSTTLKTNKVAMAALRLAVAERLDMKPPAPHDLQKICDMVKLKLKPRILAKRRR